MLPMCHSLEGNNGNPADSSRNQIKFDSSNPADSCSVHVKFDSANFTTRKGGGCRALGLPNVLGARIRVPTNLNLKAWDPLAITPQQCQVVEFLTFGFPARFERPVPTPSVANYTSARAHPQDISHYSITDIGHGAMGSE